MQGRPARRRTVDSHAAQDDQTARCESDSTTCARFSMHDANFGIGPAGTGKTYLAVACAVAALEQQRVSRILLVRPAVEAGEKLGFLPGDLAQKIDPYLRPLYDALYEMMGVERVHKYIERNIIEVAPLAFMRGRTLNNAFIILDESQNTTIEQMKMFLTRIGFGSTAVITGDITQIDLPRGSPVRVDSLHRRARRRRRSVVHALHVEGRRAASAGAADRRSVRAPRRRRPSRDASAARGAMTTTAQSCRFRSRAASLSQPAPASLRRWARAALDGIGESAQSVHPRRRRRRDGGPECALPAQAGRHQRAVVRRRCSSRRTAMNGCSATS